VILNHCKISEKKGSKDLITSSTFITREIQKIQAWISNLNEDNNEEIIPFVGRFTQQDNPIDIAKENLETLDI
jgi:hypothetical protein